MTEAELQASILDLCKMLSLLTYHTHDSRRSAAGFPDLVIAGRNGVIFAELKSATGTTTAEQDEWGWMLTQAEKLAWVNHGALTGWRVIRWRLWRPADWPYAIRAELEQVR